MLQTISILPKQVDEAAIEFCTQDAKPMLQKMSLPEKDIQKYRLIVGNELIDEITELARDLAGVRICHINSTPFGGGVAELLYSYIPLMRSLGIHADWQVIRGDRTFFMLTKCVHNALQGGECSLIKKPALKRRYRENNRDNALAMDPNYDVLIINDPQPAALRHYCSDSKAKWVWRCHLDSAEPDAEAWDFLRPFIEEYDAAVFTMAKFVPPNLRVPLVNLIPPAIDALSTKNMALPREVCRDMLENLGIDKNRPLIAQISRFDPWKDPFGVIEAHRLASESIPGLQLALVASLANDDPEGWDMYAAVQQEANKYPDIHIFTNLTGVGNMEVNAFQTASDLVLQKSIKEGFGLVVAEALWKGTPVVAGNAGGIPLQMVGNLRPYLVNSVEECAEKIVHLLQHRELLPELGKEGQEHIRQNFLTPKLIKNELTLVKHLLNG